MVVPAVPLVALPAVSVPTAVCTPAAGALGTVCSAAGAVSGAVGSAAGSVVGAGVGSVLDAVSSWVTGGAVWLLDRIGGALASSTAVDLGAPWFRAHYATMAALAGVVIVPLLLLGVLQSLYRQSAALLLRTVLVHVPLAVLLTAVAVTLVQLGLTVTDALCAAVSGGASTDAGHVLGTVAAALGPSEAAGPSGAPTFVLFLGGVAVVAGAVALWIELLLRSAAVYVAVLFLPLALAGLAWPAIAHWSRRLADTLAALVLSKLVIVAVLSLAAGALAGGTGTAPSGAGATGGGFATVLGGVALLLLAALAPWSLFRLLPFLEAGAVGHLEAVGQRARRTAAAPARGLADVALRAAAAGSLAAGPVGVVGVATAGRGGTGGSGVGGLGPAGLLPGGGGPAGTTCGGGGTGGDDPHPWEPGGSVPRLEPHPDSDLLDRWAADVAAGRAPVGGLPPSPSRDPDGPTLPRTSSGVAYVRPLARPTGALRADHLGRDRLGPVLLGGDRRPDGPTP